MPDTFLYEDLVRILPEIVLTICGTLVMVLEPLLGNQRKRLLGYIALTGLLLGLWAAAVANLFAGAAFGGMLVVDGFATFFRVLVIMVGLLCVLCSLHYLERERPDSGEYYALVLFSVVGQCLMVASGELIMLFIGLEISSIATYVLAGYLRHDRRNNESAIKYFLLGSFATAFLLYGVAWIYGITGTTNLLEIRGVLTNPEVAPSGILLGASAALMFVGFAFKVSVAPFQVWAPDVYQGAPAPVTAFMSAGP
ncbi:MAG: NADH-quinone oxidoreductase subunit N, partial [bacterium]|nr:NADH-quinone oxidoreductase subunit N [bacterium]